MCCSHTPACSVDGLKERTVPQYSEGESQPFSTSCVMVHIPFDTLTLPPWGKRHQALGLLRGCDGCHISLRCSTKTLLLFAGIASSIPQGSPRTKLITGVRWSCFRSQNLPCSMDSFALFGERWCHDDLSVKEGVRSRTPGSYFQHCCMIFGKPLSCRWMMKVRCKHKARFLFRKNVFFIAILIF